MDRKRVFEELRVRLVNKNRLQHSLAVEAIMINLAKHLHEDIELWGLAGLLHDIDLDIVEGDMKRHGLLAAEILKGLNIDDTVIFAIKAHNPELGFIRRRKIDKALFCTDHLPGFIAKCAMSLPDRKISTLKTQYLMDKFKEKDFFEETNKKQIITCNELGLTLKEFFEIGLEQMKRIKYQL